MKKIIISRAQSILLSVLMLCFLTSCGNDGSGITQGNSGNTQASTGTIIGFGNVIVNSIEYSRKPGLTDIVDN